MAIQQSFHPTARLSIASVASEILRQWPLVWTPSATVSLALDVGGEPWQVFTPSNRPALSYVRDRGKVSVVLYPEGNPSRNAAKRLASSLIRGLRPINR